MANKTKSSADIQDSKHDQERMQPQTVIINMPEVSDIPGQEDVEPLPPGTQRVPTPASDDEEGYGITDELNDSTRDAIETDDEDLITDERTNVSREERQDLYNSANMTPGAEDEENLRRAQVDNVDDDGTPLEEKSNQLSGKDLDSPVV